MKQHKKILYVDDEPLNLKLFEIAFNDEYSVTTSDSPAKAIKTLEFEKDFSIIISDMRMPGMNGIEFIKLAKLYNPDLTCFILTGYDINKEISDALKERIIKKHFSKPFNVEAIKRAIRNSD
jgi:two-component system, response regulator, stage 0 sporulation protein F